MTAGQTLTVVFILIACCLIVVLRAAITEWWAWIKPGSWPAPWVGSNEPFVRQPIVNPITGEVDTGGRVEIWHRGGVPWHDAPLPPALHLCQPQTYGWDRRANLVERCPCGGLSVRDDAHRGRVWIEKNRRRDDRPYRTAVENNPKETRHA